MKKQPKLSKSQKRKLKKLEVCVCAEARKIAMRVAFLCVLQLKP